MKKSIEILLKNEKAAEGTFLFYLHEKSEFNENAFWDYYNSVINITRKIINKEFEKEIVTTKAIVFTHSEILKKFIYHLSPKDLYEMKDFPTEKLHLYNERLNDMLLGYFEGFIINEELYDEDFKNPGFSE
ncbi:hypothetical protein [Robertmurraya sp. Marseille-Q9965]